MATVVAAVAAQRRRPLRGSRLDSFYPPIPAEGPSLSKLDSAFQLQEYIALLIRRNPHDVETIVATPGKVKAVTGSSGAQEEKNDSEGGDEKEKEGNAKPEGVDESSWIYEQLRRLAQDLSHPLITLLQEECTRTTCPEMKAGEWLYLCVAHGHEGAMEQCCAIDYIIHTLDSATALLNSPRAFPSRLSIPPASLRHFSSLARRLGRIFAHAYFHHREAFEHAEAESALYARFLALTARFNLVPPEFLVIPGPGRSVGAGAGDGESAKDADAPRLHGIAASGEVRSKDFAEGAQVQARREESTSESGERRSLSPEKPSPTTGGLESPRKLGRNRTDTMIFSDASAISEELRNIGNTNSSSVSDASAASAKGKGRGEGRLWEGGGSGGRVTFAAIDKEDDEDDERQEDPNVTRTVPADESTEHLPVAEGGSTEGEGAKEEQPDAGMILDVDHADLTSGGKPTTDGETHAPDALESKTDDTHATTIEAAEGSNDGDGSNDGNSPGSNNSASSEFVLVDRHGDGPAEEEDLEEHFEEETDGDATDPALQHDEEEEGELAGQEDDEEEEDEDEDEEAEAETAPVPGDLGLEKSAAEPDSHVDEVTASAEVAAEAPSAEEHGSSDFDPNKTLEEDLHDVEEALR